MRPRRKGEAGTTFLGVILCGMTLSLLVLMFWQGLELGGRIYRDSETRTRAILAASALMDELKEAVNVEESETHYQDRAAPLVLVSRVEQVQTGLYRVEVKVVDPEHRELLVFETLVLP